MRSIRRFNPLSWQLRTINLFFGSLVSALIAFGFILSPTISASEPPIALLTIPGINITGSEIISAPPEDRILPTPDNQIGLYRPHDNLYFLYGHSTTVFTELPLLELGQTIHFRDLEAKATYTYTITDITTLKNSDVHMRTILKAPTTDTLILMTCAGTHDPTTDTYDSRLIITAERQ